MKALRSDPSASGLTSLCSTEIGFESISAPYEAFDFNLYCFCNGPAFFPELAPHSGSVLLTDLSSRRITITINDGLTDGSRWIRKIAPAACDRASMFTAPWLRPFVPP
jgi:hypothetical protein